MKKGWVETRHVERAVIPMTPDEKKRVVRLAKRLGLTITDLVREALNERLTQNKMKPLDLSPSTGAAAYRPAAKKRGVSIPRRGGRPRKGAKE